MTLSRRSFLASGSLLAAGPLLLSGRRAAAVDADRNIDFAEFTASSRKSIQRGTEWLKKTFNQDQGCGVDIGTPSDISCTGAVGLALMSRGNSLLDGPLCEWVRKTEKFLLDVVRARRFSIQLNTQVKADLSGYADHHFAALMLSQAIGHGSHIEPVRQAMTWLVDQIARGQKSTGDWGPGRYPPLAAVTGWESLRGAYAAGKKVAASADNTARYLIQTMKRQGTSNLFANAAGVRVLYSMQLDDTDVGKAAFARAMQFVTQDYRAAVRFSGEQYLAFHYLNEAMLQRGGSYWSKWFPALREKLTQVQNADGSWTGYGCISSRTFCTACAILVLSSPNRFLPISQV